MYIDGRLRTGSSPSRAVRSAAVYLLVAAVAVLMFDPVSGSAFRLVSLHSQRVPPSGQLDQCVFGGRVGLYRDGSPEANTSATMRNVSDWLGSTPPQRSG